MENSLIIKFFALLIKKFMIVYDNSFFEKAINSVCRFFKKKSNGSIVCKYMSDSKNAGKYWTKSTVFKILTLHLRFLMIIGEKFSEFFKKLWNNSGIISFFENIINVPMREFAKIMLGYIVGAGIGLLIMRDFNLLDLACLLVLAVLSLVFALIPASLKGLYSTSKALNLFGKLFNQYEINPEEKPIHTIKNLWLVLGISFVFGIASGLTSVVYFTLGIIGVAAIVLITVNTTVGIFLTVIAAPLLPTMVCAGLVLLTNASFVIKMLFGKQKDYKITEPSLFITGFLLVALFSSLTSFNIVKSLQSYALYLVFSFIYFIIVNSIKTKNQWYNLVVVFVLAGFLVSLYGVYQNYFVTVTDTSWIDEDMFENIKTRVYSTFDNPNVLGQYLVMVIPVAFGLMWSDKRLGAKVTYIGIVCVMMACLIFTWSRAAWVGIILALGFFVVMKDRRWVSLLVVGILLMPFVLPESIISRITSLGNMNDSSTAYRFSVWLSSLRMAGDYWMSGIGLGAGAFERVYQKYALNGAGFALHSHNFYIQLVVEMGILGIFLFAMIMISTYRKIISIKGKNSSNKNIALAMGGALIGYMFQGVAENLWYNYRMILLFFIYLGILHSGANLIKSESVATLVASGIKE